MKRIYWLSILIVLVVACQDDQVLKEDQSLVSGKEAIIRMSAEGLTCGEVASYPLMVNTTQAGNVTVTVTETGIDVHYDLSGGEYFMLDAKAFAGDCAQLPTGTFPYEDTFLPDDEIRDFSFSIPWEGLPECGCVYAAATVAKINAQSMIESYPVSIQADYCDCTPPPSDTVRCEETLNLPINVDGAPQGTASIQVTEAGLKVTYDITASEWFMLNLVINAGQCTETTPTGQTISREYLQDDEVRLDSASIAADLLPECGCFHTAITLARFNPMTSQLETRVVELKADYCLCEEPEEPGGDLKTVTQGGWGAEPSGNNPGTYLHANFDAAFPNDLVVGCTYTLTFTSAQAITNFLPQGGKARALTTSYTNPPDIKNVLAGQVVALKLNVTFDAFDEDFSESVADLGNSVISGGLFDGWTVYELLAEAERALGGCGSQYSFSDLNDALTAVNESWN